MALFRVEDSSLGNPTPLIVSSSFKRSGCWQFLYGEGDDEIRLASCLQRWSGTITGLAPQGFSANMIVVCGALPLTEPDSVQREAACHLTVSLSSRIESAFSIH
jgi:hypothetical protein